MSICNSIKRKKYKDIDRTVINDLHIFDSNSD